MNMKKVGFCHDQMQDHSNGQNVRLTVMKAHSKVALMVALNRSVVCLTAIQISHGIPRSVRWIIAQGKE